MSPNQLNYQTNQQELLLDVRGGNYLSEFIIRIFLIWTMSQNSKPTKGFQPKPMNHQHFGRQGHVQPNPRSTKLLALDAISTSFSVVLPEA